MFLEAAGERKSFDAYLFYIAMRHWSSALISYSKLDFLDALPENNINKTMWKVEHSVVLFTFVDDKVSLS